MNQKVAELTGSEGCNHPHEILLEARHSCCAPGGDPGADTVQPLP